MIEFAGAIVVGEFDPGSPLVKAMNLVIREIAIQPAIIQPFLKRHAGECRGVTAVPNASFYNERKRHPDGPGKFEGASSAPAMEPLLKLVEPNLDAAIFAPTKGIGREVSAYLGSYSSAKVSNLLAPVYLINDLLCAERDQHAERDYSQLPRDGVPAMRWLQFQ